MRFLTFHLTSSVGSATPVPIVPGAAFAERQVLGRADGVTLGGRLNSYVIGGTQRLWTVPLLLVTGEQRAEVTAWWRDRRELAFTFNMSRNPQTCVTRIVNELEPFPSMAAGRNDLFNGVLMLRETQGHDPGFGLPFITDDPVLGLTDQSYNSTP